jgi:chromosome segregation ATPase
MEDPVMDEKELGKKVKWLDKQRQKDAETITRLNERLEGNKTTIEGLQRQVKELAGETARIAAMSSKVSEVESALAKHRQAISRMIDESTKEKAGSADGKDSYGRGDIEILSKTTAELREGLRDLSDIKKNIEKQREEQVRISRGLNTIENRLEGQVVFDEERAIVLASVEEGRKQDMKRITDILSELSDMRERNDLARSSVDSMQDRLEKNDVRLAQLSGREKEGREAQELWMEQQTSKIVEFERERKAWAARFDEFEEKAEEIQERALAYDETYRNLRQLQAELTDTQERLDRRIHEIGEMQRLAEDRATQEWTTFKADEQKRWNTQKLTNDEQWREHMRLHEKLASEVGKMSDNVKKLLQGFGDMQDHDRQRIMELLKNLREWAAEVESRQSL